MDAISKLKQDLEVLTRTIAQPGRETDGSYTRLPLSPAYRQAAEELKKLMEAEQLNVSEDSVGNIKGFLKGSEPDSGTIFTGSHLDTVQKGGLFDGALGIAAALLCVRLLRENQIVLRHNLQVIGFQGEEGSDLGGTFGSRSMMGLIPSASDEYQNILQSYGLTFQDILNARADTSSKDRYLELHIEQGKILESEGLPIGIVSGIVGITRYHITVNGESNHAGTTPMRLRHDALTAAARLITYIHQLATDREDHLVATVGQLEVFPGAVAVIPGKVELTLEIRHMDQTVIDQFVEKLKEYSRTISEASFVFRELIRKPSVACAGAIMEAFQQSCNALSLNSTRIPSGAGHDGNAIGQRMPIGMIFVPSHKGLSHCKEEWTDWADAVNGAMVLYHTILTIDREE